MKDRQTAYPYLTAQEEYVAMALGHIPWRRWEQWELAEVCGYDRRMVSWWERKAMRKLATLLETEVAA